MTARRMRWFFAALSISLEVTSFLVWYRWLVRQRAARHVEAAPSA